MDTNTGESPGHQSQSQLGNSPSEEEMGHWTPTGIEPTDDEEAQNGRKTNKMETLVHTDLMMGKNRTSLQNT